MEREIRMKLRLQGHISPGSRTQSLRIRIRSVDCLRSEHADGRSTERAVDLIPLRGGLHLISREANDPVTLYAHNVSGAGLLTHLAKPAKLMDEQKDWSGGTIQFYKGTSAPSRPEEIEFFGSINTSLACTHSFYFRDLVYHTGKMSPIINCTALPFEKASMRAMIRFLRTGSLTFNSSTIEDMIKCAMFFRVPQLSRLLESHLRACSANPKTALHSYKIVFKDENASRLVTLETQQIVGANMLSCLPELMNEAFKNEHSTLSLMTFNELIWLLEQDAQVERQTVYDQENAACNRYHVIMRWLLEHESQLQLETTNYTDVHYNFFANTSRLFNSVRFEHMRMETRQKVAEHLTNISNGLYFPAARPYVLGEHQ